MNFQSIFSNAKSLFARPSGRNAVAVQELEARISDEWFRSHFGYAAKRVYEWLSSAIDVRNANIIDFGCGDGIMDLGLAIKYQPRSVVGVDIHNSHSYLADTAQSQLGIDELPKNLDFRILSPGQSLETLARPVDAVFSWSVFEHIEKNLLPTILADIYKVLPPRGVFFLQIEPLYYSPHGSHLSGLIKEPWAHLLLSPDELVRRIDSAEPDEMSDAHKNKTFDVCSFTDFKAYLKREYGTLNRVTADELMQLVKEAGFVIEKRHLHLMDLQPPPALLHQYSSQNLRCNEIMLLLRKEG